MNINILLYGAWKGNLGDDLFIRSICDRYSMVTFHIFTDKTDAHLYGDISNLKLHFTSNYFVKGINYLARLCNWPDLNYYRLRHTCDAVVFLGGSLYQQEEYWLTKAKKRKDIIENYPVCFVIGNNFGPYSSEEFYVFYRDFFAKMQDVCFRDKYSYDLFCNENPKVRFAPDVVLGLQQLPTEKTPDTAKPSAVISVIDLKYSSVSRKKMGISADDYEKWITNIVLVLEARGYHVTLMGFCKQEGDHKAIARIMQNGEGRFKNTDVYMHDDVQKSLTLLMQADRIIATRFHAMILGWRLNKPVLPLVYGKKMLHAIEDYGLEPYYLELADLTGVTPAAALDSMSEAKDCTYLMKEAEAQFRGLDAWLASLKEGKR